VQDAAEEVGHSSLTARALADAGELVLDLGTVLQVLGNACRLASLPAQEGYGPSGGDESEAQKRS